MQQGVADRLISNFDSLRFKVIEPISLRLARLKHEAAYQNTGEQPLISVCIPTYNRGELLIERGLSSVLNQTYKNFEVIIIGDHCTDDTEKLVSQVKDSRIRFFNLPTRSYRYPPTAENHWFAGPVIANNAALDKVRGKWIARIDDDDLWTQDHLSSLVDFAQKGDCEFVSSLYEKEQHGKREVVDGQYAASSYFNPKSKDLGLNSPKLGGVQTWLYRSYLSFFRYNINCWRKGWNKVNDVDLQLRIYKAGARIGFLEKVTALILPRPGEQTIGLQAYRLSENDKLKHYEFKKQ